jgi:hypothetical protein
LLRGLNYYRIGLKSAVSPIMQDDCAFGAMEPALAEILRLWRNGTRPGGKIAPLMQLSQF